MARSIDPVFLNVEYTPGDQIPGADRFSRMAVTDPVSHKGNENGREDEVVVASLIAEEPAIL